MPAAPSSRRAAAWKRASASGCRLAASASARARRAAATSARQSTSVANGVSGSSASGAVPRRVPATYAVETAIEVRVAVEVVQAWSATRVGPEQVDFDRGVQRRVEADGGRRVDDDVAAASAARPSSSRPRPSTPTSPVMTVRRRAIVASKSSPSSDRSRSNASLRRISRRTRSAAVLRRPLRTSTTTSQSGARSKQAFDERGAEEAGGAGNGDALTGEGLGDLIVHLSTSADQHEGEPQVDGAEDDEAVPPRDRTRDECARRRAGTRRRRAAVSPRAAGQRATPSDDRHRRSRRISTKHDRARRPPARARSAVRGRLAQEPGPDDGDSGLGMIGIEVQFERLVARPGQPGAGCTMAGRCVWSSSASCRPSAIPVRMAPRRGAPLRHGVAEAAVTGSSKNSCASTLSTVHTGTWRSTRPLLAAVRAAGAHAAGRAAAPDEDDAVGPGRTGGARGPRSRLHAVLDPVDRRAVARARAQQHAVLLAAAAPVDGRGLEPAAGGRRRRRGGRQPGHRRQAVRASARSSYRVLARAAPTRARASARRCGPRSCTWPSPGSAPSGPRAAAWHDNAPSLGVSRALGLRGERRGHRACAAT